MKFCSKCGNQMADDMIFCQKCGNKAESTVQPTQKSEQQTVPQYTPQAVVPVKQKPRRFLSGISIFCLFGAGLMLVMSLAVDSTMLIGALVYGILGIMFLALSKTSKDSTYLLDKEKGVKKSTFILICIFLLFVSVIIFSATQCQHEYKLTDTQAATCIEDGKETYICELCEHKKYETLKAIGHTMENDKCTVCGYIEAEHNDEPNETQREQENNKGVSIADIEKWYKNEMPAVSQSLIEYSKSVNGISNINVSESKFRFGEDSGWYDCHYTYYFTCKVNGEKCIGEARAFRKYNDDNINWFHFEIAKDSDWSVIVEEYDDSYDTIIENYYKELVSQYK